MQRTGARTTIHTATGRTLLTVGRYLLGICASGCTSGNEGDLPRESIEGAAQGLTPASVLAQPSWGRYLGDVNGDGLQDLVWRFGATIKVALSNGSAFGVAKVGTVWSPAYEFQLADVNGDRKADLVGRNGTDIQVALSAFDDITGDGGFLASTAWTTWNSAYSYNLADVNGDGRADLVGRYGTDVQVALSTGFQFLPSTQWTTWSTSYDYALADVDADGKADLVGRYGDDVQVSISNGSYFPPSTSWGTWSSSYDCRLADVDGDRRADLVGRLETDISVALSNGTSFGGAQSFSTWRTDYDYALADVSGDKKADLIGRSQTDVQVGISNGSAFAPSTHWTGCNLPNAYGYYLDHVDAANLQTWVYGLCEYHRRAPVFTDYRGGFPDNLAAAADYLQREFEAIGYSVSREPVYSTSGTIEYCQPPVNGRAYCGDNIIATKVGGTFPNAYIEFTGHYDGGYSGDDTHGAKDNATAVASVLEMARILASYPSRHSMRFIAYAAEETFVYAPGATTHVAAALAAGQTIVANLNQDLTGTATTSEGKYLTTMWWKDAASLELGNYLARVGAANSIPLKIYTQLTIESQSDSWPYTIAGLVGVTTLGDWTNSGFHSAADTPQNVNYDEVRRVTQANLATGLSYDCGADF